MNSDIKKFKQIIEYRISKGEKLTNIAKESQISFPTVQGMMAGKETTYRASTMGLVQDFINHHLSISGHQKEDKKSDPIAEIENEPIKNQSQYTKEELAPITKEDTNFSELEMILKLKELLVSTPRHIKLSITIEKNGI